MDSRLKKNKKKSFIQRAKKFGKSGRFGKGKEIDRDTYDYFVRVMENMREGSFEDKESEDMFIANVFTQTEGEETRLCGNQLVSRVIERLLPKAELEVRKRFMETLTDDLRLTCTDAFASHILESLLEMAVFGEGNQDEEFKLYAEVWFLRVAKFVVNNLAEFSRDTYASHVIRRTFQCLSGCKLSEDILRSRSSRNQSATPGQPMQVSGKELVTVSEDFGEVLVDAGRRILEVEDKEEILSNDVSAGVVQALLTVLSKTNTKEYKKLCKGLLESFPKVGEESEEKQSNNEEMEDKLYFLNNEPFCRTVEIIFSNSQDSPKIFKKLYQMYFEGNLSQLSKHPVANFAVQRLIASCPDKALFEKFYEEELDDSIEEILASGNTGVILSIAQSSRRLNAKQSHFLVALMKGFHCYEPSNHQVKIAELIVHMTTKEAKQESVDACKVHINGSLLLQELLNFQKPIKIIHSFLALTPSQLTGILCDPKGCHISDAFMNSSTIGEKSREGLIKALQGNLIQLACSKHGSRSLESFWKKSSVKLKETIANELSGHESKLNGDQFGKFISSNFSLSLFKRNKEEWRTSLESSKRKAELFDDIITVNPKNKIVAEVAPHVEEKSAKKPKIKAKSYLDDL